uniref:Cytidyltransferase-like domain-containing protein n=1 Tax=Arcella intermedia TaxID=1963864 RepID=A0A6B2LDH1_9EUKA
MESAAKQISQQFYVKLAFNQTSQFSLQSLIHGIGDMYSTVNSINYKLDTVVLPPNSLNVLLKDANLQVVFNAPGVVTLANERRKSNNIPLLKSITLPQGPPFEVSDLSSLDYTYEGTERAKKICLGGTFDRIHVGHKLLLTAATLTASPGSSIVIGLADGPLLLNKSYKELIEPFRVRAEKLEALMRTLAPGIPTCIVPIADKYGPTITDPEMDALVISDETGAGLHEINALRRAKGWQELTEVRIPLLQNNTNLTQNDEKMSSSWLRKQDWIEKNLKK